MTLKELLSVFVVYSHNFKVLHWQAIGNRFDTIHSIANNYYEMLSADVDKIAEMGARFGLDSVGFSEAIEILDTLDGDYLVLKADKKIDYSEFVSATDSMLQQILLCLESVHETKELQDIHNMGIKSDIEAMHASYDLQYRYLNARRSGIEHFQSHEDETNDDASFEEEE